VKITLDSTILVRAFTDSGGLPRRLLLTLLEGNHVVVMSNEILAETSRVLRYPRMRARHGMSESRIYDYVMFLQSVATMVRPEPTLVAPIRDPNDIVVLQTAIIGGAEAICTTDEDFFHTPALAFLKSVSILVFTDMELMDRLRS
jgi:putative PIN family toxin of toxin-antitoxin system